jgi:site-specific recombinase XerD
MLLFHALQEFELAKDHSPSSKQWYRSRLSAFIAWLAEQSITEAESISASLIRRYIDYHRKAICKTGKPLDSYTLHGHVRAIRAFLNWAINDAHNPSQPAPHLL